ncbi:MAG: hypothetical protein ABJG55_00300 [Paracoccaceae bacterium]
MHIILGIIGLATAAYFLIMRARHGAEIAHELLDVADDIRAAARRFGFRRKGNQHPAESIDDPQVALAGVATAFIALDDLPTANARKKLEASIARNLDLSQSEANELCVLGQWLVEQSGGPTSGLTRLAKRQKRINGNDDFATLSTILQGTLTGELSTRQTEALQELNNIFR